MEEISDEKLNEIAEKKAQDARSGVRLDGTDALLALAHMLADETHGNYTAATLLKRAELLNGWSFWMRLERQQ